MISAVNEINTSSDEGKLLIVALAHITCTTRTDKTPEEVIAELNEKVKEIY